jgi:neutral ceramidase
MGENAPHANSGGQVMSLKKPLRGGAAVRAITPNKEVFLYGYPHSPRQSTGIHDDLLCSALYLSGGDTACLFLANDLIFVGQDLVATVRSGISRQTGLAESNIAICATHTHSGPVTVNYLSNRADPIVPAADPRYLTWAAKQMIEAGCTAINSALPVEIGIQTAAVSLVGSNRHDVAGATDSEALVMVVREAQSHTPIACAITYAMHPTVLHEDSTLISSDFPHFTREYLRSHGNMPRDATILFLNGASGDQSPRHTARSNTFSEAARLGQRLGECVAAVFSKMAFTTEMSLACRRTFIELEPRALPSSAEAQQAVEIALQRLHELRQRNALRTEIRTAECDWFGADETLQLSKCLADGSLAKACAKCSPAEILLIQLGNINLVFWPGEFFVDYALTLKRQHPNTHVVTLANGELQGYIVTPEAEAKKLYEAGNAVFSWRNGQRFVATTAQLLKAL